MGLGLGLGLGRGGSHVRRRPSWKEHGGAQGSGAGGRGGAGARGRGGAGWEGSRKEEDAEER